MKKKILLISFIFMAALASPSYGALTNMQQYLAFRFTAIVMTNSRIYLDMKDISAIYKDAHCHFVLYNDTSDDNASCDPQNPNIWVVLKNGKTLPFGSTSDMITKYGLYRNFIASFPEYQSIP